MHQVGYLVYRPSHWYCALGHLFGSSFSTSVFPLLGRTVWFPAGSLYEGRFRALRSWEPVPFVAEKKAGFIRVGMVLYVWLVAQYEWK